MSAESDLWAEVVASYEESGLISLTNIRDPAATEINTTAGENAALAVINLWGVLTQEDYDPDTAAAVEVAKQGVIAMLWRRGGSSSTIEQVKWEEFDKLAAQVRKTGPRAHGEPSSNSGVQTESEHQNGRTVHGWSDRASLPPGILPRPRTTYQD